MTRLPSWSAFLTVLSLLAVSVFPALPLQSAGAGIAGRISNAVTGEAVAGAQLIMAAVGTDGRAATVPSLAPIVTGSDGTFAVRNLQAGAYRLSVQADGYARQDTPTLTLANGEDIADISVRLVPAGALSGRVQDTRGRPLADVLVRLLRRTYSSTGQSSLRPLTSAARTNDLGEFRYYWLTPGHYYVSAEGTGSGTLISGDPAQIFDEAVKRGRNEVPENLPRMFFPGVVEEEKAIPVEVRAGSETLSVDFTLARSKGYRIRGRVVDQQTGQPVTNMQIAGIAGTTRVFRNADGRFEFTNILPGLYNLSATTDFSISAILGRSSSHPRGTQRVVVRDADVDNIVIMLSTPPAITGRVRVENNIPAELANLRVSLIAADRTLSLGIGAGTAATTRGDGTFEFSGFPEGTFRATMTNLPAGMYLKEARLNGTDMLNGFVPLSRAGHIELVVSTRGGELEGIVRNPERQPVTGVQVVLVPGNLRERTDLYRRAVSTGGGRFVLSGIVPGDYKVFAWEGLEDYAYFDPEVLARFEQRGIPVRIAEGSKQTLELPVIAVVDTP